MLKSLAKVLYQIVPHAAAFTAHGHKLAAVFVNSADPVTCKRKDIPKEFTQEACLAQLRIMDTVVG